MRLSRLALIGVVAVLYAPGAQAVTPQPGPGDPRILVVEYDPSQVVDLQARLGFQMSVEFDPSERIENVALGDSLGWQITPNRKANLLFVKPMSQRPPTNMTVVTNLRRYNFQLSVRSASGKTPPAYAVRFLYAPPEVAIVAPPPPPPQPVARNQAYTYQGSDRTLPQRMFDDGEQTYFAFRKDADVPAIFALDEDGEEAAVNTFMRDDYIVVDRIAPGFVLRRAKDVTRVYNDAYAPEPPGPLSPKRKPKDPWWRR